MTAGLWFSKITNLTFAPIQTLV